VLGLKRASNRHVGGKFELELELALAQDRTGQDRTGRICVIAWKHGTA
jgi:hypothetical protein